MFTLLNQNNLDTMQSLSKDGIKVSCVYADCIYESLDFAWLQCAVDLLSPNGIIYVQTDYHTVANYKMLMDSMGLKFLNWLIYVNEWGGTSKRFFPRKHDDILMYAKGEDHKFYPDRIQIPKVTAGTKFDKKGTGLKTPCDVFYDMVSFSTVATERVKDSTGRNIRWQKPLKLMNRLLLPVTDVGDCVFDPFMGSGTTGLWCKQMGRAFVGVESNAEIFEIAQKRLA